MLVAGARGILIVRILFQLIMIMFHQDLSFGFISVHNCKKQHDCDVVSEQRHLSAIACTLYTFLWLLG